MKRHLLNVSVCVAATIAGAVLWEHAPLAFAQAQNRPATVNWALHNLDLAGTRYSPLDQINRSNVKSLMPRWLFQHGVIDGVSNQTTPVIVDGMMYVTDSRGSVYAVDAADGHLLWTYDVTSLHRRRRAGRLRLPEPRRRLRRTAWSTRPADRSCSRSTPRPARRFRGFGKNGQASVIMDVLTPRYPDVKTAISVGYWFTTAPQFYNGMLYIGSTRSESHIPGGYVLAVDAETGKVKWNFNTIPQDEKDQGWDDRRADLGRRRAEWRRHLGNGRRSIRSWACCTCRWAIRSATARSAPAPTSSPIR